MLEDMEEDAGLVDRILRKEKIAFTRIRVETRDEFKDALASFNPDIILSDHSLPQFNSIDALTICQERGINTPFILVTGAVSEEFAVNCLKRGADDYVLKSNLSRLPLAIRHALRHRANENTRQHQEDILRRQNAELTKINQELDSFVYSVSHNLRSPLASVLGLINVAKLDNLESKQTVEPYFNMMETSITKLDQTIKEILIYSKNGRIEVVPVEVDLKQIVNECFEKLEYLDGYHNIEKRIDIQANVPFFADRFRLSVILSNLISNALKYWDVSKPERYIQISATIVPLIATITVSDNGIGIHPKYLPNVFNMFYRASEKSDGAGLGLYIVKEMLGKLNGTITITSKANEETQFTLTLPNLTQKKW